MAATVIPVDTIPSIDPATGKILAQFERTPPQALPGIVSQARAAHEIWRHVPVEKRCDQLRVLRDCMMAARDALANAVVAESGKPCVEALFADLFVALDTAQYFSKSGATAQGRRKTTRPAHCAPASRQALRIAGIS